jgi:beta-lactamase superfamily II metal-dependent hydrolase
MPSDRPRKRRKTELEALAAFSVNNSTLRPEYAGLSRKKTTAQEYARKKKATDDASAAADKLRAEYQAQRKAGPAADGTRGDGTFHISFVQMGQGDCTIMCTPGGKVVLIDCGTNSEDKKAVTDDFTARVRGDLEAAPYLRDDSNIDIVILSHPDKDHYNRLMKVLARGYTVGTVYHSGTLSHYGSGSGWSRARVLHEALIKQVILSEDGLKGANRLSGRPIDPAFGADRVERLDPTNGLIVVSEDKCEITLLAAGVTEDYKADSDAQDGRNRGSIVTLVEVFGKKILLCADATRSTEAFILGNTDRAARLKKVDIVQAGHHGSNVTSSDQTWVDKLEPTTRVMISAGQIGVPNHHLPSAVVVRRWEKRFADGGRTKDDESHLISAWDLTVSMADPQALSLDQPVYSTGSSGTQYVSITAS